MNVEDDIWWGRSKGKEESRSKKGEEEVYIEGKMTLETKEVKKRGERMGMQVVGERHTYWPFVPLFNFVRVFSCEQVEPIFLVCIAEQCGVRAIFLQSRVVRDFHFLKE